MKICFFFIWNSKRKHSRLSPGRLLSFYLGIFQKPWHHHCGDQVTFSTRRRSSLRAGLSPAPSCYHSKGVFLDRQTGEELQTDGQTDRHLWDVQRGSPAAVGERSQSREASEESAEWESETRKQEASLNWSRLRPAERNPWDILRPWHRLICIHNTPNCRVLDSPTLSRTLSPSKSFSLNMKSFLSSQ